MRARPSIVWLVPVLFVLGLASACATAKKSEDGEPTDDEQAEGEVGGPQDSADDGQSTGAVDTGGGQACASDADCVPAQCCHPDACVPASAAPDCSDVACTEECRGGTMDCGQGHCACQAGQCAAVIDNPLDGG